MVWIVAWAWGSNFQPMKLQCVLSVANERARFVIDDIAPVWIEFMYVLCFVSLLPKKWTPTFISIITKKTTNWSSLLSVCIFLSLRIFAALVDHNTLAMLWDYFVINQKDRHKKNDVNLLFSQRVITSPQASSTFFFIYFHRSSRRDPELCEQLSWKPESGGEWATVRRRTRGAECWYCKGRTDNANLIGTQWVLKNQPRVSRLGLKANGKPQKLNER